MCGFFYLLFFAVAAIGCAWPFPCSQMNAALKDGIIVLSHQMQEMKMFFILVKNIVN